MSDPGERAGDPEAADALAAAPARRLAVDLAPLRTSRDFRLLFIGKAVSYLGSQVTRVAIPFQVYERTRSPFAVGLVALFELVPILALSLWGGAVADAVDRRRLMIVTDGVLGGLSLLLAANALAGRPSLAAIYLLAALASGVFCFGRPALDATIPRLVADADLAAAAALNGVQYTLGGIAGPALGGVVVAGLGLSGAYVLDAVTFAVALGFGLALRPVPPSPDAERPGWRAVREALRWVRGQPPILGTYAVDGVAMVFGMPDGMLPALAVDRFGGGPGTLGLLTAAPAAGALAASVLSGWTARVRRHGTAIAWSVVGWGVAIAGFGLTHDLALALLLAAAAGAFDMTSGIFRMVMWNRLVPDRLRGRLAGVELASYASGPALGNVEAGAVASLTSVGFSVVSGGLACVAGAGIVMAALPAFRRYRAADPPQVET